jgi:hypothetical protein
MIIIPTNPKDPPAMVAVNEDAPNILNNNAVNITSINRVNFNAVLFLIAPFLGFPVAAKLSKAPK